MHEIVRRIVEEGIAYAPDGRLIKTSSNVSASEVALLQLYVRQQRASVSLEVGCGFATSTIAICEALEKQNHCRHYVFDPHQNLRMDENINGGNGFEGIGIHNIRQAGFDHIVEFFETPSYLGIPHLIERKVLCDFAFVDGWHTFDYTLTDMFLIDKCLRVGGIMMVDDTTMAPVREACLFVMKNLSYEVLFWTERVSRSPARVALNAAIDMVAKLPILTPYLKAEHPWSRLAGYCSRDIIVLRKRADDTRSWNHFVPF